MNSTEYITMVLRTCPQKEQKDLLTLAALGIAGEAGEVVDLIKKVLYHAQELDRERLCEEMGDLLWYLVLLCETTGISLDEVMRANVEKLRQRYPHGFGA